MQIWCSQLATPTGKLAFGFVNQNLKTHWAELRNGSFISGFVDRQMWNPSDIARGPDFCNFIGEPHIEYLKH
jgi:hypothetical protein